jgi:outer membrane receptor protein involved in Fe transport
VYAQQLFRGKVVTAPNEPVAFATVLLRAAADSSLLQTTFTDTTGYFSFALPTDNRPCLTEVSMIGYHGRTLPAVPYGQDTMTISLQPSGKLLEGVTISDRKQLIERKADRTIFNAEQSVAAIGSDVFDLLKKTPGVQVGNNSVSITGKSTVNVMINDRPVQVTDSELESLLRSMPASDVSRIEVITAPPAKYDAEGNSGIINIVTKKNRRSGLNGNITLSYEQRTKASQTLESNFNYRNGKLNVYGTLNANRYRFISEQITNTVYPSQRQDLVLDQDNRPFYTWSQAGADYNLGDNAVLGIQYTHGTMDAEREEHIRTGVFSMPGSRQDSVMYTNAFSKDVARRNVFNLNYEWKIDTTGRKLSLNADHFARNNDRTRNFTTGNFYNDGNPTGNNSDNHTLGSLRTSITTLRSDVEWPAAIATLSAGLKATFIHNNSDNTFRYLSGQDYITDPGKTNVFDYKENTQAAYISVQYNLGQWQAQAGLRAEYTQTEGISPTLNQTNTNNYFKLFPSAYIQYRPDDKHSWNLNYTRRINRPSFWGMNPFRVYSTATAYEEGNPFLQPSFSNNLELGYGYRSLLAFTAFVQKVDDFVTRVSRIDTVNNSFSFGRANAGNELQCGITASLSYSPFGWWESATQFFGTYNHFSSSFYRNEFSYGRASFSVETGNTFTIDAAKTWLAELSFSYYSRQQSDFDIQSAYCNLSAGVKKLLFGKRLVLSAYMEDILRTDKWIMRNQYNGTYQWSYYDNRLLRLSLSWKFGNSNIKERRARNTASDDTRRAS